LNLAEIGVDYLNVTNEGLEKAYELGLRAGTEFLQSERKRSYNKSLYSLPIANH